MLPLLTIVRPTSLLSRCPPLHFYRFDYVLSREHRESFACVSSSLNCRTVAFSMMCDWHWLGMSHLSAEITAKMTADSNQVHMHISLRPDSYLRISDSMCFCFTANMCIIQIWSVPHDMRGRIGPLEPRSVYTAFECTGEKLQCSTITHSWSVLL